MVSVLELRIIDDELWHQVKTRQPDVRMEMGKDATENKTVLGRTATWLNQRSMTMSPWGWQQQMSALPSAGGSIGCGR